MLEPKEYKWLHAAHEAVMPVSGREKQLLQWQASAARDDELGFLYRDRVAAIYGLLERAYGASELAAVFGLETRAKMRRAVLETHDAARVVRFVWESVPSYMKEPRRSRLFETKRKAMPRSLRASACYCCGSTTKLHVHHVDGDRTNGHLTNLETVCQRCHTIIHQYRLLSREGLDRLRRAVEAKAPERLSPPPQV